MAYESRCNPSNLWMTGLADCKGGWWPEVKPTQAVPNGMVTFMVADSKEHGDEFCHFFIDDYRFERLWCAPEKYLQVLRRYAGVIGPDYSTYTDMPIPMQMWNVYRTRALESWWQRQGLVVIPNVMFGQEDTYEWAFDGLPTGSTLASSSVGLVTRAEWRDAFARGMEECVRRKHPTRLVMYGHPIPFDAGDAAVLWYPNDNDARMTAARARKRGRDGEGQGIRNRR